MAKKKKSAQPKASPFVLDSSVTLVWAFEDETDPYAEAVADSLPDLSGASSAPRLAAGLA
jgi:hypothetical protein